MSRYDIAIIGMGCVFPKANDVDQYWRNIESGASFFEQMPDRLWHMRNYWSEDRKRTDKSYTMVGSFIDPVEKFPFLEFKLPPNTMKGSDPTQIATLESVRQALLDAGIAPRSEQLHDAVTIIGASGVDQFAHSTIALKRHNYLRALRPILEARGVGKAALDTLAAELEVELARRGHVWHPAIAAVGAITASLSNRVAQVFGARGFNMTVDGACASSFVALNVACHALMAGDARLAVVGGADLGTNPAIYAGFSAVDGLSKCGESHPFDHKADGLVIGEGVGVLILKRLEDALADGDRIRTVIRGIGTSSDGAGQAIYAPSVEGRTEALRTALDVAAISPHDVQFIEAHATSTVVGDANEYDAIASVYAPGRDARDPLILGSVKGQIGHLKAAAGMAGLIKTILAMEHGTFPHMPRFEKLTPHATRPTDTLAVPTRLTPWHPRQSGMRVAAVTSSGFGGVNYHVIVEQGGVHRAPPPRPVVTRDVAIVGIACRVAGADRPEKYWQNLEQGRDLFVPANPKELGWEEHLDCGPEAERITTRMISRIDDYKFNVLRHKIFPTAVSQIAPTQLLAVDLADRLLTDAGFDLAVRKNVGASLGAMHDDNFPKIFMPMITEEYSDSVLACPSAKALDGAVLAQSLEEASAKIKALGPPPTEHTLPGWMTNVIAGRVANRLNLCGPNFTVDTACSSGVAALLPAMYELMFGRVGMMIAGGLNQQLSDAFTCGVCALGAVAEKEAKPYDVEGKGFLIGEGGVFFLLKRLADARRDGDEIHGIIRAVGGSSEADSKSMVAPSEEAVRRAIRETVSRSGVRPEEIMLSDTHGSANQASDVVEARSIAAELRPNGGPEPVRILATKSHIGHLYGGSGASSVLTAILSLKAQKVPGIRKLRNLRPEIAAIADRVRPVAETQPLPAGTMFGAVNSLGLGGANYFAVLAAPEHRGGPSKVAAEGARLVPPSRGESVRVGDPGHDDLFLCLTGDDKELTAALGRALDQDPIPTVITEGAEITSRLAVTFDGQKALRAKLGAAIKMLAAGGSLKPLESQGVFAAPAAEEGSDKLAFCFPGQGTHYVGMGRVFYDRVAAFRDVVDRVHVLAQKAFDFDLKGHIYGDENDEGIQQRLGTLVGAQTALFAIELATARMLIEHEGIRPDVMIGHSFGEISALTVAGVWELETAYEVVKARIRAAEIVKTSGGPDLGMMSLICGDGQRDAILALVGDRVQLTNINAPGRFVLSGEKDAVKRCVAAAESFGVEARLLPIGAAFHSRFMEPARIPFRDALRKLPCAPPRIPILSTITGEYVSPDGFTSETIAEHLSKQLVTRLDLPREIGRLHGEGFRHFLEVGPGWSLTKMIDAILEGKPHRMAPTLHPKVGDEETFRRARAFLTALGHTRSAAGRHDVPGMFSADFVEYMEANEPAIIALLAEAHGRFLESARSRHVPKPKRSKKGGLVSGPPSAPASTPSTPSTPSTVSIPSTDASVWVGRLKDKLVKTTGYPPEMLEVNLDLEADLGVDSVQRAEIWVSLTTEHGLDPSVRPTGARTIAQLAESLARMSGTAETGATVATGTTPAPAPTGSTPSTGSTDSSLWIDRLKEKLVKTTGYPPEMLEVNLDLEADLGVDSVQRAEIWVSLTTEHGLDPSVRPTGARTIAQLAESLAKMSVGAPVPAPDSAASTPSTGSIPSTASTPSAASAGASDAELWVSRLKEKLVKTTGYPPEMLEVNLDLEADLGVDSVQRAEIWVSLTTEHGLDPSVRPTGARTIAQLAESLAKMSVGAPVPAPDSAPSAASAAPSDADVRLFAPVAAPFDRSAAAPFACRRVLAIAAEDDAAAAELKSRLAKRAVEVDVIRATRIARMSVIEVAGAIEPCDTIVYLAHAALVAAPFEGRSMRTALEAEIARLYGTARALVPALEKKPRRVIFPVAMDGAFGTTPALGRPLGAFPAGFVRCLARELPQCAMQLVDGGERGLVDAVEASIDFVPAQLEWGMTGSGAAVPRTSALAPAASFLAPLSRGDLVLVTGGARGVVFECVMELARRTGCRLLLTGRTELPMGRPEWLRTPPDRIDGVIRDMEIGLVKDEGKKLPEAKRIGAKARSQWELSRNLDAMEAAGVEGRYERCDVTDATAFSALIAQLADAKEIVRGVVHGAGIQKSRLVTELTDDAIALTVATKLDPVFTMLDALDWSKVKLFSGFGSIAGLFGNAGQTDYGLANDLLAWLVAEIGARYPHVKAQTVEWTAWVGTGMVTDEEAKRFAQVGLQPLDVRTGVRLYAEATLGSTHPRVAAFNASAPFTAVRPLAEFPLAARPQERLLSEGPAGGPPVAVFSERHHPYIRQHLVRLEPVVPGTFVVEVLAEATAGSGRTPTAIQFRRPLGVRAGEVAVEVVEDGGTAYVVPRDRPALTGKALANLAFSSCRLESGGMPPADDFEVSKKDVAALLEEGEAGGAGFYRLLDSRFSGALKTGPAFRGIRATVEKDGLFLASAWLTDDAMAAFAVPGRFVFNPVLADMAVQAAAAWAMIRCDRMEIPFEIGALHVLGPTRERRSIIVCRAQEIGPERTVVDLVVREPDGRPILAMDRLVLRTIEAAGG